MLLDTNSLDLSTGERNRVIRPRRYSSTYFREITLRADVESFDAIVNDMEIESIFVESASRG